jgi:hypothetical protein
MDLDGEISRGIDAKQVLNNAVYREAFRTIEDKLIGQLAVIEITTERAEYLRQLLVANRKIKSYLEQVMVTGQMANEQKSLLDRAKEKVRSFTRY